MKRAFLSSLAIIAAIVSGCSRQHGTIVYGPVDIAVRVTLDSVYVRDINGNVQIAAYSLKDTTNTLVRDILHDNE